MSSEGMDAEFDTVAEWTADVARDLGDDYLVPAGCRGSGGPRNLDRILDALEAAPGDRLLDVGAGVGGPAAYAAQQRELRPVLVEPEPGACRAARQLFGFGTVQAGAAELPVASGVFDAAWSIGVLCTLPDDDKQRALDELARATKPGGRIGLLVYEAQHQLPEQPEGNQFPTAAELRSYVQRAGLDVVDAFEMVPADAEAHVWQERVRAVEDELVRRHHDDPAWVTADRQSTIMGRLIGGRHVVGRVLILADGARGR